MVILDTERLRLQYLQLDDAAFIVELLNDPAFIRYIADRGVRTESDAHEYLRAGPLASYAKFGFGLFRVSLLADGTPIGMCGLLQRPDLPDADIGFAYLPQYVSQGYAHEAAAGLLAIARERFGLPRVLAITNLDNERSVRLLTKLGFEFQQLIRMPSVDHELRLFSRSS